ncbi:MAG: glycosyltransferase [Gemmatimonadota bacterium]|nr:glycosyltransferase [Gemmatimonadota bacterium]
MTLAGKESRPDVSVLVPAKDEALNLPEFVKQTAEALGNTSYECELIVVDDGSIDDTPEVLSRLKKEYPFLGVVTHRSRRGIADALKSGGEAARGRVLVFYPADLQFLPSDIPSLVEPVLAGEADVVTGTKQGQYEKAFVSGVYNRLCRWLFKINVADLNAVKAYSREVMAAVPMRPDWHRFMVVIAATEGFRVEERAVTLHPRNAGTSKFGIGRIPVGITDLLSVWFQLKFGRKPMLFFGVTGGLLFFTGFLVGVAALILRFGYGIGFRPMLDLVMVLVVSGIALFGFGFLGEMLAGTKEEFRSMQRSIDSLAERLDRDRN